MQVVQPRYWLAEHEIDQRLETKHWDRGWLLGWRDIARSSDERTFISSVLPRGAADAPERNQDPGGTYRP